MQTQIIKWVLVLLGTLLVCLAGWWFFYSLFLHAPKQGQATPDGTQFPIQDIPYTAQNQTQGSSQASTPSQSSSIADAFASLFSQVGATSVRMTQVDASSSGESAAIYALYAEDVSISKELYPRESNYPIDVALIDLNDDGTSEAIVYEYLPGFCGTLGCPLGIYQKQGGTWNKIFSTVAQGDVGFLNVYVNSYRSLLLTSSRGGPQSSTDTYAWDGKTYQAGTPVAAWNGTSFVLNQ